MVKGVQSFDISKISPERTKWFSNGGCEDLLGRDDDDHIVLNVCRKNKYD
jgi:hypothetical protein